MHLRIRIRFWLSDTVRFPRFVRRGSGGRGVIVVRIRLAWTSRDGTTQWASCQSSRGGLNKRLHEKHQCSKVWRRYR